MKVHQFCHGGTFENTTMKVTKQDCILTTPSHSYKFQGQLRALTEQKLKYLRHISRGVGERVAVRVHDLWPDFVTVLNNCSVP